MSGRDGEKVPKASESCCSSFILLDWWSSLSALTGWKDLRTCVEFTEYHTYVESRFSLCKRLQRNGKVAFKKSVIEVPVAFCLFLTNNIWFLATQLCATRKCICLLLRANLSPHLLKSRFDLDKGVKGSPQQSEGMRSMDNQDPSTWACSQHLLFYQNGCTQLCEW